MDRKTRKKAADFFKTTDGKLYYYKNVLDVDLDKHQKELVVAIHENERTACSACHDLGKSFTIAREMLYYLPNFPGTKVITTAPTWRQVESILWSEARTAYQRAKYPLGGKMLTTEWKIDTDWFALGFSPRNEAQKESGGGQGTQSSFQGFHPGENGYLIVIFDEATGIPKQVWTMAEGLLTSGKVKFIAIGNPTSMQSEFYRCFSDRAWKKVKWSCFDSPNLIANGITELQFLEWELEYCRGLTDEQFAERRRNYKEPKPHLLTLKWVISQILKWGMSHPLTHGKILGQFPIEGDNVKMPLSIVEAAQARSGAEINLGHRRSFGIDCARYGTDKTVFTYMHGPKVLAKKSHSKLSTMAAAGQAVEFMREHGGKHENGETVWPDVIVVDETGVGGGVVDALVENQQSSSTHRIGRATEIRGVQFGASAAPKYLQEREDEDAKQQVKELEERYVNMKARMFDLLAEDLKVEIELLPDAVYTEQLPTILYFYDSKGRLKIESKDDYKKRTSQESPDEADSLALANFGRHDALQTGNFTKEMIPGKIKSMSSEIFSPHGGRESW